MPLDPAQIRDQAFHIVFRGYDVASVDAFLDRVEVELADLLADRDAGSGTPGSGAAPGAAPGGAEAPATDGDGSSARALRTLARAEQTAEEVVADATAEAEQLRIAARAEADEIISAARTESCRLEAELQMRRHREVGALVVETQQLRAEIDRLGGLERRLREDMQARLAEHQRAMEQHVRIGDVVPAAAVPLPPDSLHPAA